MTKNSNFNYVWNEKTDGKTIKIWLILVITNCGRVNLITSFLKEIRDKLQDLNINQLNFKVHDSYENYEKITTDFEPTDDSDVINKGYLEKKFLKKKVSYHY